MSKSTVQVDTSRIKDTENMTTHDVLVTPEGIGPAVLVAIHDMAPNPVRYAVRLYSLELNLEDNHFHPQYEIEAFSFHTHKEATKFANRVKSMSAIEMLIILNAISAPGYADGVEGAENTMVH